MKHWFINSNHNKKHFLSTYYVPGVVLGSEDIKMNMRKFLVLGILQKLGITNKYKTTI